MRYSSPIAFLAFACLLLTKLSFSQTKSAGEGIALKIMTYNVHHCNPPSRPGFIDLDAIANAIQSQSPDLLALQEIDANTGRSGKGNQAALLAEKLHMKYFFAKAIDYDGGEYGIAILSKFPIKNAIIHRLPTEPSTKGEPRVLATAKIRLPGKQWIVFGSTHMDAQQNPLNRQLQIREINRIAAETDLPFIVAGDFNASPGTEVIHLLDSQFNRSCQACEPTIPQVNPNRAIDFIAYRPEERFSVISQQVVPESYASDHLPVVAVLKFASQK